MSHRTTSRAPRLLPPAGCRALAAALCPIGLAGCMSLSQPYQPTTQFGIVAPDASAHVGGAAIRHGALRIGRVRVNPPADSRHFLYRMDEATFTSDYHNEFVAPPDRLLSALLIDRLIATGPFATIVEPGGTADATLRLESTVTDLHGDFRDLTAAVAVIRARFVLLEDAPDATRQRGAWTIERREPIASPAAADLAAGHGRAWSGLVDELARELASAAR